RVLLTDADIFSGPLAEPNLVNFDIYDEFEALIVAPDVDDPLVIEGLIERIENLGVWVGADAFANIELPIFDLTLGDVIDFQNAFRFDLVDSFDWSGVASVQDFLAAVDNAGLVREGSVISYGAGSATIAVPLGLTVTLRN